MRTVWINLREYQEHELACPDCGARLYLRPSKFDAARVYYACPRAADGCKGAHSAHPDGRPMGDPADPETRTARRAAHAAFDQLWQGGEMSRTGAYRWLQKAMGMNVEEAHIGRFDAAQCARLIELVEKRGESS